jgi:hypothetical protein
VIGLGFQQSSGIFIPFSNLLGPDGFVKAFALLFAYFVVITSWIGHYKSSARWKYGENKSGILRFTVSIFILYLYYYLVILVNTLTKLETKEHYEATFVYVLPAIFISYLLYDIIKNREHRHERGKKEKEDRRYRLMITVLFLPLSLFFLSQSH